jgi:hypothetical protein
MGNLIMPELTLPSDYLGQLIVRMRAVQGREDETDTDSGSNATDDQAIDALQETPGDLTRDQLRAEIRGLSQEGQAELVALLLTGRGDAEPEEWQAIKETALESAGMPVDQYLLAEPLVGDLWAEGLERLGLDVPLGDAPPLPPI